MHNSLLPLVKKRRNLLGRLVGVKLVLDLELLDQLDVFLLGLGGVGDALLLVGGLPGLPLGAGLQ
jgi:hypothetical protein